MPLNADWYKVCMICYRSFWCALGEKCQAPECDCLYYVTPQMLRSDEVRFVICGRCEKAIKDWLRWEESKPRLRLEE